MNYQSFKEDSKLIRKSILGQSLCITGFSLTKENYYPAGRHLRGAFGLIAYELNLEISQYFLDFSWDGIIFRDMLPLCKCGLPLLMWDKISQMCPHCHTIYQEKDILKFVRTIKTKDGYIDDGWHYRFNLIYEQKYEKDVKTVLDVMQNDGFSIGKRRSEGWGSFCLEDYVETNISPNIHPSKALLISHAITPNGEKEIRISKYIISTNKFNYFGLKYIPKGNIINDAKGFYYGEYGSLGFGEYQIIK